MKEKIMSTAAGPLVPKISNSIRAGYLATPDTLWPTYDGKFLIRGDYVTASQVNNCERWVWFDKNQPIVIPEGVVHPAWGFFERGHLVESWVVRNLRTAEKGGKYTYSYLGEDQRSFYHDVQSGTPDGLAQNKHTGKYTLLEFKSYDPRSNIKYFPKKAHIGQVTQNMDLVMECLDITIERAVIHYQDASDFSKAHEFTIEYDDAEAVKLQKKSERIMKAKSADEMEPAGMYTGDCRLCSYGSECSDAVKKKQEVTAAEKNTRLLGDKMFAK